MGVGWVGLGPGATCAPGGDAPAELPELGGEVGDGLAAGEGGGLQVLARVQRVRHPAGQGGGGGRGTTRCPCGGRGGSPRGERGRGLGVRVDESGGRNGVFAHNDRTKRFLLTAAVQTPAWHGSVTAVNEGGGQCKIKTTRRPTPTSNTLKTRQPTHGIATCHEPFHRVL